MSNFTLDYYNANTSLFVNNTQSIHLTDLWNRFTSKLPKDASILDFGCGSGRDTKYFLENGFNVDAIDGSVELCAVASKYTGINVSHQLFVDLSVIEKYDGVWACSSILHAKKDELEIIMQKIFNALKPNGILYTSFKYGDFEGERNGRYFTDFTKESFLDFMKKFPNFKTIETWITSDVRPGRGSEEWLNVILQKM